MRSNDQLTVILTFSLRGPRIQFTYSMLRAYNLNVPTWRECWNRDYHFIVS